MSFGNSKITRFNEPGEPKNLNLKQATKHTSWLPTSAPKKTRTATQTAKELAIRDKFGSDLKLQNPERDRSSEPVQRTVQSVLRFPASESFSWVSEITKLPASMNQASRKCRNENKRRNRPLDCPTAKCPKNLPKPSKTTDPERDRSSGFRTSFLASGHHFHEFWNSKITRFNEPGEPKILESKTSDEQTSWLPNWSQNTNPTGRNCL